MGTQVWPRINFQRIQGAHGDPNQFQNPAQESPTGPWGSILVQNTAPKRRRCPWGPKSGIESGPQELQAPMGTHGESNVENNVMSFIDLSYFP